MLVRASIAGRSKDVLHISRKSLTWDDHGVTFQFFSWKTQFSSGESSALSKPYRLQFLSERDSSWCAARALQHYLKVNEINYRSAEAASHDMIWTHFNSGKGLCVGTVRSDCKKDLKAAGVPDLYGPGTIRHAAISLWHALGVPREEVAKRTGHKSLAIISVYYDKSVARDLGPQLADQMRPQQSTLPQHPWDSDDDSDEDEH